MTNVYVVNAGAGGAYDPDVILHPLSLGFREYEIRV